MCLAEAWTAVSALCCAAAAGPWRPLLPCLQPTATVDPAKPLPLTPEPCTLGRCSACCSCATSFTGWGAAAEELSLTQSAFTASTAPGSCKPSPPVTASPAEQVFCVPLVRHLFYWLGGQTALLNPDFSALNPEPRNPAP